MGKQGPCGHCGIATTPLWRNGPVEKPVLCNACGSRWRTKGTLSNYMPMHSGGFGGNVNPEGSALPRGRKNRNKALPEPRSHKRMEPSGGHQEKAPLRSHLRSRKVTADDSLSTSILNSNLAELDDAALSINSEDHMHVAASSPPWKGRLPTKKRTSTSRVCRAGDKLSKQFQETATSTMLHGSADELLVDSKPSTMADEIGLGSIFIKQPTLDEHRMDANILSIEPSENLYQTPVQRQGGPLQQLPNGAERPASVRGKEKAKEAKKVDSGVRMIPDQHVESNNALLENFPYNKRTILQSCQSPLVFIALKDIINFDTFTGLLTDQEQGQLMRFLSSVDVARASESLKEMFTSAVFEGSLTNFQHLLEEGMFESSMLGVNPRILQQFQLLLNLTDLTSSSWMEQFFQLQNRSKRRVVLVENSKTKEVNKEKVKGLGFPCTKGDPPSNRLSPGRVIGQFGAGAQEEISAHTGGKQYGDPIAGSVVFERASKVNLLQDLGNPSSDKSFGFEAGGTCYNNSTLLSAEQACDISCISAGDLPDLQTPGSDESEADLLFNMPTNMMTFQDTLLLQQPLWSKPKKETDTYQVEIGSPIASNMWHMDGAPPELFWNPTCAGPGHS